MPTGRHSEKGTALRLLEKPGQLIKARHHLKHLNTETAVAGFRNIMLVVKAVLLRTHQALRFHAPPTQVLKAFKKDSVLVLNVIHSAPPLGKDISPSYPFPSLFSHSSLLCSAWLCFCFAPEMGEPLGTGRKVAGLLNRTKQITNYLSDERICLKLPTLMGSVPSCDLFCN